MRRFVVILAAAAALVALGSVDALARGVTFGSTLRKPPTDYNPPATCDTTGANMNVGPCTRVALRFDATGAVKRRVRAPRSGFIRRIRIRAARRGKVRVQLARVSRLDYTEATGDARVVSRGRVLRVKGRGLRRRRPIESFRVRIRVRKGDYLAIKGSTTTAMNCGPTPDFQQLIFQPPLRARGPAQPADGSDDCTLLVQATIRRR